MSKNNETIASLRELLQEHVEKDNRILVFSENEKKKGEGNDNGESSSSVSENKHGKRAFE